MWWAAAIVCTCLPADFLTCPHPLPLPLLQSALDDVEEHLQPFLEAGPKEMAKQVTGVALAACADASHPLTILAAAVASTHFHPHPACVCLPVCLQLTPLERLKAHLALAQAAVVLYTLDRQLDAAKLEGHPIQKELVRLWLSLV